MKARLFLLLCLLAAPLLAQPSAQLQDTLAKIVFAHQVNTIRNSMMDKVDKEALTNNAFLADLASKTLQLQASDISSGPVKEIANRPLAELVSSLSNNRSLDVGDAIYHVTDQNKQVDVMEWLAPVKWNGSQVTPLSLPRTLNDYIKLDAAYACTNYIAATITANFEGQIASWRALYLTGCPKGAMGAMQAIDLVMRDAVPEYWNADVYPWVLQIGQQASNPAVRQWLRENASPSCLRKNAVCVESGRVVIPQKDSDEPVLSAPPAKTAAPAAP